MSAPRRRSMICGRSRNTAATSACRFARMKGIPCRWNSSDATAVATTNENATSAMVLVRSAVTGSGLLDVARDRQQAAAEHGERLGQVVELVEGGAVAGELGQVLGADLFVLQHGQRLGEEFLHRRES